MTTDIMQDQELEKQMGCMAGFLQIFDRHQILAGKRLYSHKRLPSSSIANSATESESREFVTPKRMPSSQSYTPELRSPAPETMSTPKAENHSTRLIPLPLPMFEFKEGTRSPWKFSKEAPRLSLDSRAIVDAKGSLKPREIRTNNEQGNEDHDKLRRSPGVIARLMGLDPNSVPEPVKPAELRRSASESRVSTDLLQTQNRFVDGVNFKQAHYQPKSNLHTTVRRDDDVNATSREERRNLSGRAEMDLIRGYSSSMRSVRDEPAKGPLHRSGIAQRRSFFDSAEIFPEPKQSVSIYGEIEKRLKMRGIDEPSKDLETLKQILEALQLKGLLHSKKSTNQHQINQPNFIFDKDDYVYVDSPIVVMKPVRSPVRPAGAPRNPTDTLPSASPRRDRSQNRGRGSVSPTRSESGLQSPSKRWANVNFEGQRKLSVNVNEMSYEQRRSPVQSPRVSPRRTRPDQTVNRSPRVKKPMVEIYHRGEKLFTSQEDELSSISDSISTSDTERSKMEDYKEGRNLLERCDKLLLSIAEMTSANSTELQPSPVSVLDSSFYKEESSPSPVMKRSIEFKDQSVEFEDDLWGHAISPVQSKLEENFDDCDFLYISDILRASHYLTEDSDIFLLLEKQQYLKGRDTSKVSTLDRRLIFDTISEIRNRKRQLPPWKAVSWSNSFAGVGTLQQIWSEFQKIKERDASEDLFEVICGFLRKDLAEDEITGWGDCPTEMSEAVLDIERRIFKDLIGETIQELADSAGKLNKVSALRRKLTF